MDIFKKLAFVFFLGFSGFVSADTYTGILTPSAWLASATSDISPNLRVSLPNTPQSNCVTYGPFHGSFSGLTCTWLSSTNSYIGVTVWSVAASDVTCPGGGTVSGANCINAPACVSPAFRKPTGLCYTPPVCSAAQTYNAVSDACIDNCLPSIQGNTITKSVYNTTTKLCEKSALQVCTSPAQVVNSVTFKCDTNPLYTDCGNGTSVLKPQACVAASKTSVIDCGNGIKINPPATCPAVPPSCPSGSVGGFINGVASCVASNGRVSPPAASADGTTSGSVPANLTLAEQWAAGVAADTAAKTAAGLVDPNIPVAGDPIFSTLPSCAAYVGMICQSTLAYCKGDTTARLIAPLCPTVPPQNPTQTATTAISSVANPDGSTTKTTTTSVSGQADVVTTVTTAANGNQTGTTTGLPAVSDSSLLQQISDKLSISDCDKHPEHVGCASTDTSGGGSGVGIDSLVSFTPSQNFGITSVSGACPAPQTLNLSFKVVNLSFEPACNLATGIKPFVLIFAYISAISIVLMGKNY